MGQTVPSLGEPISPLAWSSCADPAQIIGGRRAPSLIMSRISGSPSVCVTQCRGFDSLEPPGKIEPAPLPRPAGPDCRRDNNISVAVGLSYNRPSGRRRPLRRKRRKCREPSLTPITNCPL
jgi:hypothetical protein